MRQFFSCAICLVLSLCGTVSARQDLVEYKDTDDPCVRFKMRILVPRDHIDFRRQAKKLEDGIDYKMVWNPCPQAAPQFAFVPGTPGPNRQGNFLRLRSFGLQFPTVSGGKTKQSELAFPRHPLPFDKWLQ
jgi:hypothetical protein